MRYIFAILALSAAAVRAVNPPEHGDEVAGDEVTGDSVARDQALVSSGIFKYAEKDHPASDAADPKDRNGKIVGTGEIGKSVFTSAAAFLVANPPAPGEEPKARNYDIIRESHVTAQGLEAVADAGTLTKDGRTLGAGHVSIMIPKGKEMTVGQITDKMEELRKGAVRGKNEIVADQIVAKANADPTRTLAEIKAEVNPPPAKQPKQSKKGKKSEDNKPGGGAADPSTAEGSGTTNCKRDGSFCLLSSRPKKTTATGKNAASTVTKKTAGNPKSRKAATNAATAASKKPTTRSKTRLASSKDKAITGKKTVKGSTGRPTGSKKDKKVSSKQSTGSKKGANTKAAAAGRGSRTKKADTTKKAGARGKGASSTKATTTKLRKPATGKKGSTAKKAATMAGTKNTTGRKLVAKPAGGSSKKQTFTALSASKKLSSGVVGNAAKSAAPAAKSTTKRIHRRELTMNRPRMVYEAVQEYKRGLMQESVLDKLD